MRGVSFLGDATNFLIPNLKVEIEFYEGKPMGIELPPTAAPPAPVSDRGF